MSIREIHAEGAASDSTAVKSDKHGFCVSPLDPGALGVPETGLLPFSIGVAGPTFGFPALAIRLAIHTIELFVRLIDCGLFFRAGRLKFFLGICVAHWKGNERGRNGPR